MGHRGKKSRLDGTTCAKKASWGHLAKFWMLLQNLYMLFLTLDIFVVMRVFHKRLTFYVFVLQRYNKLLRRLLFLQCYIAWIVMAVKSMLFIKAYLITDFVSVIISLQRRMDKYKYVNLVSLISLKLCLSLKAAKTSFNQVRDGNVLTFTS